MTKESDLKSVAGSVRQAPTLLRPISPIICIRVETDHGPANIFEEDLSHSREIMNLKPGDYVTARVTLSPVGNVSESDEYHVWELKHDGVTIESYQDAYLYGSRELEQYKTTALWLGLAASICLMVALALRMHFGAWVDPTPLDSADAADYDPRS